MTNSCGSTLQARDAISNKRLAGGDSFVAWLEGPATVHANVADRDDGSYSVTYCTTIAGVYQLYVTNGAPHPHSFPSPTLCRRPLLEQPG